MSARSKARKKALDFLFAADIREGDPVTLYNAREKIDSDLSEEAYVLEILQGVAQHKESIDELISTYAQGWDLDRMPNIDRNILRVALYELIHNQSIPDAVAISEAVELAGELSTKESATYINGVLSRIVAIKASL